jgi:hypothetical protein
MNVELSVEWELAGKTEVLGENLPSVTLSTTNPTRPDLGSNPGRRCGKPATNSQSYGTALFLRLNRTREWLMHQVASEVCAGVSFQEPQLCVTHASTCVTWQQPPVPRLQSAVLRNAVSADVTAHLCSGCRTARTGSTRLHPYQLHWSSAFQITARCSSWYLMPFWCLVWVKVTFRLLLQLLLYHITSRDG